jgi:hypothetical protein
MTDWKAVADARRLGIPDDFIERVTIALEYLEEDFTPLLRQLKFESEPAITLSEAAVLGKTGDAE